MLHKGLLLLALKENILYKEKKLIDIDISGKQIFLGKLATEIQTACSIGQNIEIYIKKNILYVNIEDTQANKDKINACINTHDYAGTVTDEKDKFHDYNNAPIHIKILVDVLKDFGIIAESQALIESTWKTKHKLYIADPDIS